MRKIRVNDDVIVIAGKDKGRRGTVTRLLKGDKVLVSGVNIVKKHQKPNPQADVSGGIIEREAPLHISNIAIFNATTEAADKVGFVVRDSKKVRVYKSSGDVISA